MSTVINGKVDYIDRKETLRYLGYSSKITSLDGLEDVLDECEKQVLEAQKLTACYDIYSIVRGECLDLGFAKVESKALSKNLEGCDRIILFAATAGAGIDRLIAKYNRLSPARAIIVQAMGAAIIEQWCDIICKNFQMEYGANKSRFSCGYGDLPLTLQRDIFAALNVTKNLGITLSDNCFMTPTKSVTAIVGVHGKSFCGGKNLCREC
jgi:hypothetical protein